MKLKDLAAVLMAGASFLTAAASFWQAIHARADVKEVDERLYDQAATGIADNADEVAQLRERLAKLEKHGR